MHRWRDSPVVESSPTLVFFLFSLLGFTPSFQFLTLYWRPSSPFSSSPLNTNSVFWWAALLYCIKPSSPITTSASIIFSSMTHHHSPSPVVEFASEASPRTRRVLGNGSMCPSGSSIAKWNGGGHSPKGPEGMLTLALRSNTELDANYGSSQMRGYQRKRETRATSRDTNLRTWDGKVPANLKTVVKN